MGKICIGPSLFNINEPLMFGAPVVFNPLFDAAYNDQQYCWPCGCMADHALWPVKYSIQDGSGRTDPGSVFQCDDYGRLESRSGVYRTVYPVSADLVSILQSI